MNNNSKNPPLQDRSAGSRESGGPDLQAEITELKRVIRRGNDRWKRLVLLETLGLGIAAPLAYLWIVLVFDSVFHLPLFLRLAAGLLFLAAVAWQTMRLITGWRHTRFSDDQVALAIERNTPGGIENRLINSIQLASHGSAESDRARIAVVRENYQRLKQMRVEHAARGRPAAICLCLAAAAIVAGIAFRAFQPDRFSIAAARILLPFADVAPMYRTQLFVEPGDISAELGDDVRVSVRIEGRVPDRLIVISRGDGARAREEISVPPGSRRIEYVFANLSGPLSYAVRGGDYTSPFYSIRVPVPSDLQRMRVSYTYPEYTGLPERVQEGTGGDLQAVYGTEAALRIFLTRPAESATLVFSEHETAGPKRLELAREGPAEFSGTLTFEHSRNYQIETRRKDLPPAAGRTYEMKVTADEPPEMHLEGISEGADLTLDAVLPVTVSGRDDFGLTEAGVFTRPAGEPNAGWQPLQTWAVDPQVRVFEQNWILPVAAIGAAEGDLVEVAARGRDNNPLHPETWHTGQRYTVAVGGEASRLQVEYERILKAESDLAQLIEDTAKISDETGRWIRALDPGADTRWDDAENLRKLENSMSKLAETQSDLRSRASAIAREMPEASGSLKLSVGMLADTEMVRAIQMIEGVSKRDNPRQKRSVLGEARLTQERATRSLRDLLSAYTQFRRDWELRNMIPFTGMLARRQSRMGRESMTYAELPPDAAGERLRTGAGLRQRRLKELTELAQVAFSGIAERSDVIGPELAAAFGEASETVEHGGLKTEMEAAADHLSEGEWLSAAAGQERASEQLDAVYEQLRRAQTDTARRLMEELRALAADDVDAQAAIKELEDGFARQLVHGDTEVIPDIINVVSKAEELKSQEFEKEPDGPLLPELEYRDGHFHGSLMPDEERDFSIVTLGDTPGGQGTPPPGFESEALMEVNLIKEFHDLVGDLLEEADDIREEYVSIINLSSGQDLEPGDVGKGGLRKASVSGHAFTGNLKPDTHEHGGASRIGRQGARALGVALGDESISRRGRDEAQESSQEVPDVEGAIRETLSDDPARDHSTGVGGRLVEGDLDHSFSVKDAGEWDDSMVDRMQDPQEKFQVVERKGSPLDPEVAERLRAVGSNQEQMIERIKLIKKELDNLYLPTDHLDEAVHDLSANLDRLRERPDPEAFQLQLETLDRLIGAVMVFDRPVSEFQPSLPREAVMRGEILDEPPGPTLPGYEEVVKRYYERLSSPLRDY